MSDQALDFAAAWAEAYSAASPAIKRRLNQAIFKKIYVYDDGTVTSALAEPFGVLLGTEVTEAAKANANGDPDEIDRAWREAQATWAAEDAGEEVIPRLSRGGLNYATLVGPVGLEPTTYE